MSVTSPSGFVITRQSIAIVVVCWQRAVAYWTCASQLLCRNDNLFALVNTHICPHIVVVYRIKVKMQPLKSFANF